MKKTVAVSCPLDCFDLCRFNVTVENNQVVQIQGDKEHPTTQGLICHKGKNLANRFSHPDRIQHPLVRSHLLGKPGNGFERASYNQVLDLVCNQLISIKKEHGPTAIIDYVGAGYGGLKGRIQSIFFNAYGGATRPEGSLCWGAGIAAQKYDFGSHKGHFPDDVLNADLILVWGRNPKITNLHLFTRLKKAQKLGKKLVVIDPVQTATAKSADQYMQINPSTDAALALAMAKIIIDKNLHDIPFIEKNVIGFKRFKASLEPFTPKKVEQICGIPAQTIKALALEYATSSHACIYLGFGMQRYENSGNTIRSIDALAAISGKVGKKGCGVNYAAKAIGRYLGGLEKNSLLLAKEQRSFTMGQLGRFLQTAQDPPVKAIFVAGTNPLNQGPDIDQTIREFSKIPFKVVFDHFMTDTANQADIVLPAASVFEQEDVFATSMYSPVLNYSEQAIDPPKTIMSEFDFYMKLAAKMGLNTLGFQSSDQYLYKSVGPVLEKLDIDFGQFKKGYPSLEAERIAWSDNQFTTPSGKIEIYSKQAKADGLSALPDFIEPLKFDSKYPLRLLTCHCQESMHSQSFAFIDDIPTAFVNEKMATDLNLEDGSDVVIKSKTGQIKVVLKIDNAICNGALFMHQGFWQKSGSVNCLTEDRVSDMGKQAAFYDTFCKVIKLK